MQKLMIIGNLTRDPEYRGFDDGKGVCNFTVAVNRRTEKDHPEADYFRVAVWGKMGEACNRYLSKGKKVCVVGNVRAGAYTDKDGNPRGSLEVLAQDVEFLTPRGQGSSQEEPIRDEASGFVQVEDDDLPF